MTPSQSQPENVTIGGGESGTLHLGVHKSRIPIKTGITRTPSVPPFCTSAPLKLALLHEIQEEVNRAVLAAQIPPVG